MVKAAFMLSVKSIVVCHNAAHIKVLKDILRSHLLDEIQRGGPAANKFLPADKDERLEKVKPDRLKHYEQQRKRSLGDDFVSPEAKRSALGTSVDAMLASLEGTPVPKAKAKGSPKPAEPDAGTSAGGEGKPAAAETKATPAKATAKASPPEVGAPSEDLQALLAKWAK